MLDCKVLTYKFLLSDSMKKSGPKVPLSDKSKILKVNFRPYPKPSLGLSLVIVRTPLKAPLGFLARQRKVLGELIASASAQPKPRAGKEKVRTAESFVKSMNTLMNAVRVLDETAKASKLMFAKGDVSYVHASIITVRSFRNNLLRIGFKEADINYLLSIEKDLPRLK